MLATPLRTCIVTIKCKHKSRKDHWYDTHKTDTNTLKTNNLWHNTRETNNLCMGNSKEIVTGVFERDKKLLVLNNVYIKNFDQNKLTR